MLERTTIQKFQKKPGYWRYRALGRGTQREYTSKPFKHSIVERILVFKWQIQAYFYPLKIFICSDFLAKSLVIRKLQGSKLTFSKISIQAEKRLKKILGEIRQKWAIIPFSRCSKILGEAGKQEILQEMFRKFWISNRLPNRHFPKIDVGCP